MSRRMYSKNQLENIVEDKIRGFDAAIPTDLYVSGDELGLAHDGEALEPQTPVHFKQLFGKHSLMGEGNIDLYVHFISITNNNLTVYVMYPSSNNLKCDSIQDLNTLFAGSARVIPASGRFDDTDAQNSWTMEGIGWDGKSFITSTCEIHQEANGDYNNFTFGSQFGSLNWEIKDVVQSI